jgi:hypothetical protein
MSFIANFTPQQEEQMHKRMQNEVHTAQKKKCAKGQSTSTAEMAGPVTKI